MIWSFFLWVISQVSVNISTVLLLQIIVKCSLNLNKVAKISTKFFISSFYTWQCSGRDGAKILKYITFICKDAG